MPDPVAVAVCTPSRGLIHSRTVAAVAAALATARATGTAVPAPGPAGGWVITHDLPIPDAFNEVAALALGTDAAWLWWVEEDMVPPPHALTLLLATAASVDAQIVALDYAFPTVPPTSAITRGADGTVRWCGLGCTLVRRDVFARLERPWFRTDTAYRLTRYGTARETLVAVAEERPYGGQDIDFCVRAGAAGFRLAAVPATLAVAGHLRLASLGLPGRNAGAHTITAVPPVERGQ